MSEQNSNNQKPLNEGYQPIQKGFSPKPITSQARPPKGGTGESSTQGNKK
ncbi:hypothetical protein [Acetivibrio mesophilus]|nr:hypothetical protein [Acetivibrio mesophilus]